MLAPFQAPVTWASRWRRRLALAAITRLVPVSPVRFGLAAAVVTLVAVTSPTQVVPALNSNQWKTTG